MTAITSELSTLLGTWTIDPAHSRVGFAAKHAMVTTVRGLFEEVAGTIEVLDPATANVDVTIQTASVNTSQEKRDGHLRSADFFDVENNPTITFISTGIEDVDGDEFVLVGDLTVRGVTKQVKLDSELQGVQTDHAGNVRAGFEATGAISRQEFGLTWNAALEAGGVLVSDKIKLALDISAVKQG